MTSSPDHHDHTDHEDHDHDDHDDNRHDHAGHGGHGHGHAPSHFRAAFAVGTALNLGFVIVEAMAAVPRRIDPTRCGVS